MSPSPASTSRRRRPARPTGEEREQAIVTTLADLLEGRPLHTISVDDLASGAGISRPTFYFYFASKEAVLVTLLEQLADEIEQVTLALAPQVTDDPRGAWQRAIGSSFAMWRANQGVIAAATEARGGDPEVAALWDRVLRFFIDTTAEAIAAERARGVAPDGLSATELATCLNRMNERVFEATLADEALTLPADGAVATLTEVWMRAIYGQVPLP